MALQSKTIIGSTSDSAKWTFKAVVTENSINEDNETSSVKVEVFLGRPSTQTSSYFAGNYDLKYNVGGKEHIDEDLSKSSGTISAGGWCSIGSHTFDIPHIEEPMEIDINVSMSGASFNPSSASASGKITLTEILGGLRIGIGEVWKKATAYLGVNGVWKKCKVYIGKNNEWKKGR